MPARGVLREQAHAAGLVEVARHGARDAGRGERGEVRDARVAEVGAPVQHRGQPGAGEVEDEGHAGGAEVDPIHADMFYVESYSGHEPRTARRSRASRSDSARSAPCAVGR